MHYSKKTLEKLATRAPGSALTHGWILDGAGPARFGWAIRYPSGKLEFLARRMVDAIDCLTKQDAEHAERSERDSVEWHSMRLAQAASGHV
jgi:hypothetical protein